MSLTKVTYSMIEGSPYNVLDYGAVGDGSTNDTTAIQAAIDAAAVSGGTVVLPSLTYRARELRFKSDVNIVGMGSATIKLHTPGTSGYIARSLGQLNVNVSNIVFDCTTESGNTNTVGCVEVDDNGLTTESENIVFTNCTFKNAQNNAWLIFRGASKDCKAQDCFFYDHLYETTGGTHGLSISEDCNNIQILNCVFDHPSGTVTANPSRGHIGIDRSTNVLIDGCILSNAVLNGITIEDNALTLTQIVKISNSTIQTCGNSGLQLEGNGLIVLNVENCTFRDNVAYGLKLAAGSYFRGMINTCWFSGNASTPNLAQGYSQLFVNLGQNNAAQVVNCQFYTDSSTSNFIHVYYLNGELTLDACSFTNGTSGYGVYSVIDLTKMQERDTAILRDLRFDNVGTPTYYVPQFFGDSWVYAGAERKVIETIITRTIITNSAVDVFDIWTSTHNDTNGAGTLYAIVDTTVSQVASNATLGLGAGATYRFTATRRYDGTATLSSVNEDLEQIVAENAADRNISAMTMTISNVNESGAKRLRVSYRVDTTGTTSITQMKVAFKVKIVWDGFLTAPVFI